MNYVDVILPLPLEGFFTYALQPGMQTQPGCRVVVPLGKSKKYLAVVHHVHSTKPDFDVRFVEEVVDEQPVCTADQLWLWQWIADYYLSPIGEVMNAALPLGLKDRQAYRPKTETYVTLPPNLRSERELHIVLDILRNAPKQQKAFATFLALTSQLSTPPPPGGIRGDGGAVLPPFGGIRGDGGAVLPPFGGIRGGLSKQELMNEAHCTSATIKQLIDKKFLITYQQEIGRLNPHSSLPAPRSSLLPLEGELEGVSPAPLSPPQQDAYNQLLMKFLRKKVVLLHGVTSSGKTEIYIHLIQRAIDNGQQVLYLLPEIALTVQMRQRLQRVFGYRLGIYHSKYSDAERVEIWKKQLSGNPYDVILGARSAVLLPFQRLGLIIVDEEHETSFKQQDPAPRYHARSVAILLAQHCGAQVLLGTATPCAETFFNAQPPPQKYGYVRLSTRYQDIQLPLIQVVDIKDLQRRKMMNGIFSPTLLAAMREAFSRGEQVILFQNRRGFAPMIECNVCGWVPRCQNCDVSLTYHKNLNVLSCHYCGFTYRVPDSCPNCENPHLHGRGFGTEKIEDQIMEIFPDVKVARMDLDSTRSRQAYERIITDFSLHKTDVLVGTQMVTKGLDFEHVSVVGILNADAMLNMPDFRAYEQAFTMMAQVAGRAGRKNRRGLVILQTKNPDNEVVRQLVSNNFQDFFSDLIAERQAFHYPPFCRLIYVYLKHRDEHLLNTAAIEMASRLRQSFSTRVLGPDKPPVPRIKALHIRKIMLKIEPSLNATQVRQCLRQVQQQMLSDKQYTSLHIYYDVDPL